MSSHSLTASWQLQQNERACTTVPPSVELPSGNRCAGACTQPTPPLPSGVEGFRGFGRNNHMLLLFVVVGTTVTLLSSSVKHRYKK